ncbi:hypothetical protein GCM10009687_30820 [Asanoa iriomotensis]
MLLFGSLVVVDAIVAGLAAVVALGTLDLAAPDLLEGPAPLAAAWRIATVLTILELASLAAVAPFFWRRGLGEMIASGLPGTSTPPISTTLTAVWAVVERAAAVGIVFAWQFRGSVGAFLLSAAVTVAALVAARALFRHWLRRREEQRHEDAPAEL